MRSLNSEFEKKRKSHSLYRHTLYFIHTKNQNPFLDNIKETLQFEAFTMKENGAVKRIMTVNWGKAEKPVGGM